MNETSEDQKEPSYQPPAIETVLKPEDLEREAAYAGIPMTS